VTDKSETTDQSPKPDSSEPQPDVKPKQKGVFLMKAKGQSLEEFKKFCIKRFREAGLITNNPQDEPQSDKS
jgi:hypothetical protein